LTVGDPVANHNLGPVINKGALASMLGYVEAGKKESRLVAGGSAPATADGGYFLEPTVFADVAPDAALAQEEIFGPVLAVIKVESFEEGLKVANNTEYGLTGSIYSTDREKLNGRGGSFMWAISTSIASAPAPWWERIRLAAST
jgi:1-pyrroline-5-carboxylate dehydrogenase